MPIGDPRDERIVSINYEGLWLGLEASAESIGTASVNSAKLR